jgi:hypothetical protein
MTCRKNFKMWQPDPIIAKMIKPYYTKGYPASVASTFAIRDDRERLVKNPNIKTYFRYWNYWKQQDNLKLILSLKVLIRTRQRKLEAYWLPQYYMLTLIVHEMENALEHITYPNGLPSLSENDTNLEVNLDSSLNTLFLKVMKLELKIIQATFYATNKLILCDFDFNYSRHLRKIATRTHYVLIRVLSFLSKHTSKKVVLDCQCKKAEPAQIIIKCGICAARIVILSNSQALKEKLAYRWKQAQK